MSDPVGHLFAAVGIALPRYLAASVVLRGGPVSESDAVEATGLAPRQLDVLWEALGAAVDDQQGRRRRTISIPSDALDRLRAGYDERAALLAGRCTAADARERLVTLVASLPAAKPDFDQVPATVDTLVARVQHLDDTWELRDANVLFLGDHDGTSVAMAAMLPQRGSLSVVDIDHDLLTRLRAVFAELRHESPPDCPDRTVAFADLRLALPSPACGVFDLVVTDPPYTSAGVGLFVRAARAALKPGMHSRIVLHYGASALTPGLVRGVQQAIADAGLVVEELRPGFSSYSGAHAIGARSDLYVLRPVASVPAVSPPSVWAVYSHGQQSQESGGPALADAGADVVVAALLSAPESGMVEPDLALARRHGHLLVQILLSTRGRVHNLTCDNDTAGLRSAQEQLELREAVSGQYTIARIERSVDGTRLTRVRLLRSDSAGRSPWSVVSMRPHSKLTASIADALIGWCEPPSDDGSLPQHPLTKRTAKEVAQQMADELGLGAYRLVDLETPCILAIRSRLLTYQRGR